MQTALCADNLCSDRCISHQHDFHAWGACRMFRSASPTSTEHVPGGGTAHLEALPGASRSSHSVDSERSEAARGASGGGLCSYRLSSALEHDALSGATGLQPAL